MNHEQAIRFLSNHVGDFENGGQEETLLGLVSCLQLLCESWIGDIECEIRSKEKVRKEYKKEPNLPKL